MFKRVFGRRQEQSISPDRLAMLQIDYVGGYFEGLSPTASQEPRALFWAAAFKMLDSHHLVKKGTSLDFTSFPAHVVAQLSYMHTAILGEPAAAAEAMKSLDPAWYMPIRMMKERADSEKERADSKKAAASSANSSEVALVSGQIDLLDVLGDRQGKRFSAVLLDWIKRQPPDPDLWHDIATAWMMSSNGSCSSRNAMPPRRLRFSTSATRTIYSPFAMPNPPACTPRRSGPLLRSSSAGARDRFRRHASALSRSIRRSLWRHM